MGIHTWSMDQEKYHPRAVVVEHHRHQWPLFDHAHWELIVVIMIIVSQQLVYQTL